MGQTQFIWGPTNSLSRSRTNLHVSCGYFRERTVLSGGNAEHEIKKPSEWKSEDELGFIKGTRMSEGNTIKFSRNSCRTMFSITTGLSNLFRCVHLYICNTLCLVTLVSDSPLDQGQKKKRQSWILGERFTCVLENMRPVDERGEFRSGIVIAGIKRRGKQLNNKSTPSFKVQTSAAAPGPRCPLRPVLNGMPWHFQLRSCSHLALTCRWGGGGGWSHR